MFHVRERFVVHDMVEETLLSLIGQPLDRGSPSSESSLEGIRELGWAFLAFITGEKNSGCMGLKFSKRVQTSRPDNPLVKNPQAS